jgi:hypothetical protein
MAVDILKLVKFHIQPALEIDNDRDGTHLEDDLQFMIDVQIAQQGMTDVVLTDQQSCLIAALTLEALRPRLALLFTDEIQEHRTGPENKRLPDRVAFFRELGKAISDLKAQAAQDAGVLTPGQGAQAEGIAWTSVGIVEWGSRDA